MLSKPNTPKNSLWFGTRSLWLFYYATFTPFPGRFQTIRFFTYEPKVHLSIERLLRRTLVGLARNLAFFNASVQPAPLFCLLRFKTVNKFTASCRAVKQQFS
jgi:hypothetical protein